MLNNIDLQGRLTRDPELKRTQSGTAVCSFSVACERDVKDQNGERKTDFIECVAWRGTAELLSRYFRKGSMIVLNGRLELRDWKDRDGNNRRSAEVRVNNIYFTESKQGGGGAQPEYQGEPDGTANFGEMPDIDDGELPF